ncbi:MAG: tetratricopeptide repeat protein [Gammaproteobacteria bacterium]
MTGRLMLLLAGLLAGAAARSDIAACQALADAGDDAYRDCYLELLRSEDADAVRAEALWRLGNKEAANAAFRRANVHRPEDPDLLTRWGLLYLSTHQAGDAEALFQEALAIDPNHVGATLGMAELLIDRFDGPARAVINRVLTLDPGNQRARILDARLAVEAGDLTNARAALLPLADDEADVPVRRRLEAMALLAAADHMDGTAVAGSRPSPWAARALALNPRYGDVHATPAHFYVITRRYREAVTMLEQAVAVDPELWQAHSALGTNLLRVNRIDDGRRQLETAYRGDAFNAETVNTLRLLDTLNTFDTHESAHLVLRTHPDETAVLTPYVQELVNSTVREMAPRYHFSFERPIVLELYQHHDDFAVRTAGLPGIGILGATFGDVVVMDGPSAKPADEWDWISAVWHEFAHVVTLNATNNLVSRWFSEGVSVYEEQHHGPSRNTSVPLDFLEAMAAERLLPVAELDQGFLRPQYPNQIGVSYTQAGLVCAFIAERYEDGLTGVLEGYAGGADTPQAIEQGLGVSAAALDEAFFAWLNAQYGAAAAGLADYKAETQAAFQALKAGRWADAVTAAEAAIAIYPAYTGPANPRLALARAREKAGEVDLARQALTDYLLAGGRDPTALAHAVELSESAGAADDAYAFQFVLARIDPLQAAHHARLGDLAAALGKHDAALAEYRAVLALGPHDKAAAHFHVASTLHALKRNDEARLEVLKALEIAPRYSPALALLVELTQ